MCKAIDEAYKRNKVTGAIEAYQLDNLPDEIIISKVMKIYDVSKQYVQDLLTPEKV